MTILYSVIARGSVVLCSHQIGAGSYDTVMNNILPNIPVTTDARTSYTSNNNLTFHVMVDGGLIYLCASESSDGKRQPYAFLNEENGNQLTADIMLQASLCVICGVVDIKRQFMSGSLAHRAQFAVEGELNRDFQPVLVTQMERFSETGGSGGDQITTLQSQVEEVKGVMTQNIERVLERGDRLEDLMDKTSDLEANAQTFKKTSRQVQRKMWWKNTRWTIILVTVSIVVVAVVILIILFATHVLPPISSGSSSSSSTATIPPTVNSG